jgi:CBS domain containing-hemolysin-like protein
MITKLVITVLDILAIGLFSFALQHIFTYNAKIRIKNLLQENDALIKVNYKVVAKTDRQKNLIELQQKAIDDLSEEVKQYRNSFNNN